MVWIGLTLKNTRLVTLIVHIVPLTVALVVLQIAVLPIMLAVVRIGCTRKTTLLALLGLPLFFELLALITRVSPLFARIGLFFCFGCKIHLEMKAELCGQVVSSSWKKILFFPFWAKYSPNCGTH